MVAVIPNPRAIRSFRTSAVFETWLARNHDRQSELWLRMYKKDSGVASVNYSQALDVALCWGWIDGLRKSFDEQSFLQRFTPRKPKSIWSQNNREHVARLIAAGRMTPHGIKHVEAAKADGRWDKAYAAARNVTAENLPPDLRAAIDASPRARKTFAALDRQNLFSLVFRTNAMKTPGGRARKIAACVAILAAGKPILQR